MKFSTFVLLVSFAIFSPSINAKLFVFACEPEWRALADELGGEQVITFSATTGLQDPHHIQARPSLIAKMRQTDLLVCTGADLEAGWLPLLLRRAARPSLKAGDPSYLMATEYVRILGRPKQLDRSQGDIHATGNPHIQTNPDNIKRVAIELSQRLVKLDAEHSAYYQQRLGVFLNRWKIALRRWKRMTRPLKDMEIVVHHASWLYLQDWLKLKQVAVLEEKPGIPPTSSHLSTILKQMKQQPAKVIIHAAYQTGKPAKWLSDKTAIPVLSLPFTVGGNEQSKDLFSLYEDTFTQLLTVVNSVDR